MLTGSRCTYSWFCSLPLALMDIGFEHIRFLPAKQTDTVLIGTWRIATELIMPTTSTERFNSAWNLPLTIRSGMPTCYSSETAGTQVAFSTVPTQNWFSESLAGYYLLGFSYYENVLFEGKLLERIHPRASVYVINVEGFFQPVESDPVKMILNDPKALDKYETKRFWQGAHERICKALPLLCGKQFVIFRSRETGRYYTEGAVGPKEVPVSYDPTVNNDVAKESIATAITFLSHFAQNKCVILTIVPYIGTEIGTAEAIASGAGLELVTPRVEGLRTYDGYHLDQPSAQRWSQAFFQAAGPEIQSCLAKRYATDSQGPSPTVPAASVQSATTPAR